MRSESGWAVLAIAVGSMGIGETANAQIQIPLGHYLPFSSVSPSPRLVINVGIAGGPQLPYLFDTGSELFASAYNPATWGTIGAQSPNTVPSSNITNGNGVTINYESRGGYTGNILTVPNLTFGATGSAVALPTATPGYQLSALTQHKLSDGTTQNFPAYFTGNNSPPPVEGLYYGTFGAGNFTNVLNGYVSGGILGQATIPGTTPGYVVSANARLSFGTTNLSPTNCIGPAACVTLGLTPALIAQFTNTMPVVVGKND